MSFIGQTETPFIMTPDEVDKIMQLNNKEQTEAKYRNQFYNQDEVIIQTGSFANFTGTVIETKPEENKVVVEIMIFGRATPTEFFLFHNFL